MINENAGYYQCGDLKFESKVDACIWAQQHNTDVKWIFHNDTFSAYPWQVEPELTLDQFYDLRARELREKYDYIIISYSGGSDSVNMVESFLRQGLHIDEIIINHLSEISKSGTVLDKKCTDAWNFQAEHELQAIPRLQEIHARSPKTKITVIDTSNSVNNILSNESDVDWTLRRKTVQGLVWTARWDYFKFNEMSKMLDTTKKTAMLFGTDKPQLKIKRDNNVYVTFTDIATHIPFIDYNKNPDLHIEFFYWSKETAPMVCKQAHILKRAVESNRRLEYVWRHKSYETRSMVEDYTKNIIYTTWDNTWFQTNKPTKIWYNRESEIWYRDLKKDTRELHLWDRGLEYLISVAPKFIRNSNEVPNGFVPIQNDYFLGPFIQR